MSEESQGFEQWQDYINTLSVVELQALRQHFLARVDDRCDRPQLAKHLYRFISDQEFIDRSADSLNSQERSIMATLIDLPTNFSKLKLSLSFKVDAVQLGMILASLRSRLLLGRINNNYFVPKAVQLGLGLQVSDILTEVKPTVELQVKRPWLEEGLILATVSFLLQGGRNKTSTFGEIFASAAGEQRWRLLNTLLFKLSLITKNESEYRPILPSSSLLAMSHQQRCWHYWALLLEISSVQLYQLLWPLRKLAGFSQQGWQCWLQRFTDIDQSDYQRITMLLLELNLLISLEPLTTKNSNTVAWRLNPFLEELLDSPPLGVLSLSSTLELYLSSTQITLELSYMTFCCEIKHYDTASVYQLQPHLLQRLLLSLNKKEAFSYWLDILKQRGIQLNQLALEQLKLFNQDSQRHRYFSAVPVLACSVEQQELLAQLPGLESFLLLPAQGGIFLFNPYKLGWKQILSNAGIVLEDCCPLAPAAVAESKSEIWPPPLTLLAAEPTDSLSCNIESQQQQQDSILLRSASGLNYSAKKQLLASIIENKCNLVKIKLLPNTVIKDELLVLPVELRKNSDGSMRLYGLDLKLNHYLELEVGQMLQIVEYRYALLYEPLWQQAKADDLT